jgi:cleavage stimulation factor subunit 2
VIDRDSGRSRGYGFCEYEDADTAASAVRNLNGYEINGRSMRVDFSENDTVKPSTSSSNTNSPTTAAATDGMLGQQLPVTQSATDAITAIIGSLTANQLFDIMSQMKSLVRTSPEQARAILLQAPQISYALFQALIIMKVITPATIQQVLRASAQPPPQMAPQMHPPYPPHPHQQLPPHPQHIMMHPPAPHIMQQQQQYQNQQQQVPVQQGQASIDLNSLPEEQRVFSYFYFQTCK